MVNENTRFERAALNFALTVGEKMQGLVSVWGGLSMGKRLMLAGSVAATIIAFSMLARTASTPTMALLYSGLESGAAGEVVAALEKMNVETDVRGNSIFVPSNRRDFVRMALAQEGLPQQGQAGYELLENLNGFSTTSEIFDVTYWRAMEGELARTILATPGVSAARVHIAHGRGGAFSRNGPEPKGVVTVTMGRGGLSASQANAIRFLVASSVPGLAAEQVAVLDSDKGVILSPGASDAAMDAAADASDRERRMEADVLNLLEARVGAGNARVQIALDIDTEREAISERMIDPEGRVISGKNTKEITEKTSGSEGGALSVASNLAEGDDSGSQTSSERTQTDQIIEYDISEVRREREKAPGAIRRLSAAVLVNHIAAQNADGETEWSPRSDEELEALKELISMAVGFSEERGDTITIQSMPFKEITNDGVTVERNLVGDFIESHLMMIIQIAVLSIVTLILALFVVKPVLSAKNAPPAAAPGDAIAPAASEQPVELVAEAPNAFEALKGLANERTDETATLIKTWLEEENAA